MGAHALAGRMHVVPTEEMHVMPTEDEVCMCHGIFEQYVRAWKLLYTVVQGLSPVLSDIHWQTRKIPGDHPHW